MPHEIQFAGARLKIQRAIRHVQELQALMVAFHKTEFCKVHLEKEATGREVVKIDFLAPPPVDCATIIGDVIHNIKCALDHIAYEIAAEERVYFPKGAKRENIEASPDYRLIQKASPEVANFILNDVQPYMGGKCLVWELTSLDNMDKHRLLIPTLMLTALQNVTVMDEGNNIQMWKQIVLRPGGKYMIPSLNGRVRIYNSGRPAADIFFDKGSIFSGQSAFQALRQAVQTITGVIESLEALWFAKNVSP